MWGDAQPEVLADADGLEPERIAPLEPDLVLGIQSGMEWCASHARWLCSTKQNVPTGSVVIAV